MADEILKKILYDNERKRPRFGRRNFKKKFWMKMSENAQDLADEILKKFWMTMSETPKIWQTKF